MDIKHYFHDDRIVIEVKPENREELEKIIKFVEFAEVNNPIKLKREDKEK